MQMSRQISYRFRQQSAHAVFNKCCWTPPRTDAHISRALLLFQMEAVFSLSLSLSLSLFLGVITVPFILCNIPYWYSEEDICSEDITKAAGYELEVKWWSGHFEFHPVVIYPAPWSHLPWHWLDKHRLMDGLVSRVMSVMNRDLREAFLSWLRRSGPGLCHPIRSPRCVCLSDWQDIVSPSPRPLVICTVMCFTWLMSPNWLRLPAYFRSLQRAHRRRWPRIYIPPSVSL